MGKHHQMSTCNICKLERCTFSLPKLYFNQRSSLAGAITDKKTSSYCSCLKSHKR
ncbi:hypothetical protein DB29_02804 [Shouchella clausii]|nr:hypothetical protein DB29_02804 [Shouchella clausii]